MRTSPLDPWTTADRARRLTLGLAGACVALAVFAALAMVVALIGLGRLHPDLDPVRVLGWLWHFRADPDVRRWTGVGMLTAALAELVGIAALIARHRRPLHGAARWAREEELLRANLRSRIGVVLGKRDGRLITFGGDEHVMLYAPTRTGKGVGVVIPTLLTWPRSLIVLDVKRENWAASAGFRAAAGQAVFLFDPLDPKSARFNPVGHIDRNDRATTADELQKLAVMLFPTTSHAEAFWAEAARIGFIGVAAYVAETQELPFTLGQVYRELTATNARTRFRDEVERRRSGRRPLSPACAAALEDFCSASDNTFASVRQTITSRMGLFLNPRIDAATSTSDFDLAALGARPISLYLGVTPDNLPRVAPLYNLLLQQFIDASTRTLPPSPSRQADVLVVLDEFARLGHAAALAHAFSFVAGYGVRLLCVLQSPSQLRGVYGPDVAEEIMANCGVQVVFAPTDIRVAQALSERLGYHGQRACSHSRPQGLGTGRRSVTESEQRRALMLPQELIALPPDDLIVLRAGVPPIRAQKLRYYEERAFLRRVLPPPNAYAARRAPDPPPPTSLDHVCQRFAEADELPALVGATTEAERERRAARGPEDAR